MSTVMDLSVFDPKAGFTIIERRLPHWSQAGVICFITFRTDDSMPREVVRAWRSERMRWLRLHHIDPVSPKWKLQLSQLDHPLRQEFYRRFSDRWQEELDQCHGACVLARPELSKIVANSLHYFDGDRYELTDFVVMPNHVHVLAAFVDEEGMLNQVESWKHYTAVKINRILGKHGRFWQQDGFDHLLRTQESFDAKRTYIADNPKLAGIASGQFRHYSKRLSVDDTPSSHHAPAC